MNLEGEHDEPALRRIYPHFVRSRVKKKMVSVGGVGEVRLAARRVAWIECQDFATKGCIKKWWDKQGSTRRGARDCWGLTPEVEFIILHGLGITEQRHASPYTALKGVGGKRLTRVQYGEEGWGDGDTGTADDIVVAFPTEEEGKRIAAEWVKEGRTWKLVVITERENVGEEISSILGTQRAKDQG